jgi:hypothetical protein
MKNSPGVDEKADQAVTRLVRNLPLRPAPATLESRVVQQLERDRTIAWWRRGFTHWPAAARIVFVGACMAIMGVPLLDTRWSTLSAGVLQRAFSVALSWAHPAAGAIASASSVGAWIEHSLSSSWFYALAAIAALLYATLVGLGVAAYRALYFSPHHNR